MRCRVRDRRIRTRRARLRARPAVKREIAPGVASGSAVDPDGQEPALDAERLECANLLRLGGEPRQAGVLEHVVEREQAPQEHFIGSGPAVAEVLGAERAVDPAPADPADFPAFQCLVGCQPSLRHGPDEPKSVTAARSKHRYSDTQANFSLHLLAVPLGKV